MRAMDSRLRGNDEVVMIVLAAPQQIGTMVALITLFCINSEEKSPWQES